MLQVNDKIKYVDENGAMGIPLNTVLTVKEIQGVVLRVEGSCMMQGMECVIQGVMSYDEVEKHFEKVVEKPQPKNTWTEWRKINKEEVKKLVDGLADRYYIVEYLKNYLVEKNIYKHIETRNNGKKTDVRISFWSGNSTRATSTCNTTANDEFDEAKGIEVALIKCFVKQVAHLGTTYINTHY